jgi:hypothetical protein
VLMVVVREGGLADLVLRMMMVTFGAYVAVLFAQRVRQTYMADRENYERMEGKALWYPPYRMP